MNIIKPSYKIMDEIDRDKILKNLERYGRTCYKSEDKITPDSASKFVRNIMKRGHESVIEHEKITVKIICDRGVSHEIVRHRLASYSQSSTRYCAYNNERFGGEITCIDPCFWEKESLIHFKWKMAMLEAEKTYMWMLENGATPEQARSVLPNSLQAELVMTMNLREWRHFFKMRTQKAAHPQMREIAVPLLKEFQKKLPEIYDDIVIE